MSSRRKELEALAIQNSGYCAGNYPEQCDYRRCDFCDDMRMLSKAEALIQKDCDICAGTGKSISGKKCACNDTGRALVALQHFRERLDNAEKALEALNSHNIKLSNYIAQAPIPERESIFKGEEWAEMYIAWYDEKDSFNEDCSSRSEG